MITVNFMERNDAESLRCLAKKPVFLHHNLSRLGSGQWEETGHRATTVPVRHSAIRIGYIEMKPIMK